MPGRRHSVARRLIAGIALYGLVLANFLYAFHVPAAPDADLVVSELCLGDHDSGQPASDKHDGQCPICLRLAGFILAPPPAEIIIACLEPARDHFALVADRAQAFDRVRHPLARGPPTA